MIETLIVEDNPALRKALVAGLEATGEIRAAGQATTGEQAVERGLALAPQAVLMDVELRGGRLNGIQAAVALRRELPRLPVVFYSIQDDDQYFREFRDAGILSHYAYVRKSNYLLPQMILPLLADVVAGLSFIDPEIESRVEEVRQLDEGSPLALLEPNEQVVARMLAQGLSNEQIAGRLGFRDKRTISRTNGQIYAAWGLAYTTTDEKVARTRAALIVRLGRLVAWDEDGTAKVLGERGRWVPFDLEPERG